MPNLRRLSGDELIRGLERLGFTVVRTRGSHVKLRKIGPSGESQSLTIPRHRELDTGTCRAILRQAIRYVSEAELRPLFYTD